jgi:hypothetical protein
MAVWEALAVAAAVGDVSISGAAYWAWRAYRTGQLRGAWLRLRIKTLGGVTTLDKKLRYKCAICQYSLSAHEKVRKLSCGHVFHSGKTEKCEETVEKWLYEKNLTCPFCRKTAIPVCPWNARPPLSASRSASSPESSDSSSGLGSEQLLPPSTTVMGEEAAAEEEPRLSP